MANSSASAKCCDLCDGTDFELIARVDRHGQELLTDVCTSCGLVCHRHVPSEQQLADYYGTRYRQDYKGEAAPSARRVLRAQRNGLRLYRRVQPWLKPGHSVLEIGAGIGYTVKMFEQHGYEAAGIEPHVGYQRFAADRLHARVRNLTLSDLERVPHHDLVLLIHVIEHLRSPREALSHLHALLRPEGLLYVECPNLGAPFARPKKLFHRAHLYNFTPWTLTALAGRCGFEIEHDFGAENNPNLQMLLRRVAYRVDRVASGGYFRTMRAVKRYNDLTYHMRWSYLRARAQKVTRYAWEFLVADRDLRKLAKEQPVAGEPHSDAGDPRSDAA